MAEVRAGEDIHKIESETAPVSLIETNSSTYSGGEVCIDTLVTYVRLFKTNFIFIWHVQVSGFDPNSQNSSEDVTTPFVKRKQKDDLPDITSTSKKLCKKTVKMEKTKSD